MMRQIVVPLNTAHTSMHRFETHQAAVHTCRLRYFVATWMNLQVPTLKHKRLTKIE